MYCSLIQYNTYDYNNIDTAIPYICVHTARHINHSSTMATIAQKYGWDVHENQKYQIDTKYVPKSTVSIICEFRERSQQ